jgi:hypothetical protein
MRNVNGDDFLRSGRSTSDAVDTNAQLLSAAYSRRDSVRGDPIAHSPAAPAAFRPLVAMIHNGPQAWRPFDAIACTGHATATQDRPTPRHCVIVTPLWRHTSPGREELHCEYPVVHVLGPLLRLETTAVTSCQAKTRG